MFVKFCRVLVISFVFLVMGSNIFFRILEIVSLFSFWNWRFLSKFVFSWRKWLKVIWFLCSLNFLFSLCFFILFWNSCSCFSVWLLDCVLWFCLCVVKKILVFRYNLKIFCYLVRLFFENWLGLVIMVIFLLSFLILFSIFFCFCFCKVFRLIILFCNRLKNLLLKVRGILIVL